MLFSLERINNHIGEERKLCTVPDLYC